MSRIQIGVVVAMLGVGVLVFASGCEQPKGPGETYHKKVVLWPIYDMERWEGVDGEQRWVREQGDAVAWLATWEKEKRYDDEGFLIYNREKSMFFPIYSTSVEETEEYVNKEGSVLLWPYKSSRDKTLGELEE